MPEWLSIILRSLVTVIFLFAVTKMIGKRQLSQMTFFEYTVGIVIGEIAGYMAIDIDNRMFYGILALAVFTLFPIALGWGAMKSKFVRNMVEGKARILVKDGKVLEDNLKKERMTADELLEQLRLKNAFKVADVEFALMEPNGQVSVLMKSDHQPMTPKTMGMQVNQETEPQTVILDGTIMDEPLATHGLNRRWLQNALEKQGVTLENVFIGQVDSIGQLYVDLYDDKLKVPAPQENKITHATLKKCQADLELFALSTKDPRMKKIYGEQAEQLQRLIDEMTPLLTR